MEFELEKSIEILERTPDVLEAMLRSISIEWASSNEGGETWSPFDVVGHLIHGEKTDWIKRMEIILSEKTNKTFDPFDRFAQFKESHDKTMDQLLDEFKILRESNIEILKLKNVERQDLSKIGIHPELGEATLGQLLATWVVHDLNHIAQIARVMAHQYKEHVGPWEAYLRILKA